MTWAFCRRLLSSGHSPEQAAGRCVKETGERVSHEYLYRRIYANKASGGKLWRKLGCQKLRRKRYGSGKRLRVRIANRVGIEQRCPRVETRSIIGHWEGDTIIDRNQRGVLMTLVECRSRFSLTRRVFSKGAGEVAAAIIEMLMLYRSLVRTLIFDNGLDFARPGEISMALNCKIYLARPYASWQRGSSEYLNGFVCANTFQNGHRSLESPPTECSQFGNSSTIERESGLTGQRRTRYWKLPRDVSALRLQVDTKKAFNEQKVKLDLQRTKSATGRDGIVIQRWLCRP